MIGNDDVGKARRRERVCFRKSLVPLPLTTSNIDDLVLAFFLQTMKYPLLLKQHAHKMNLELNDRRSWLVKIVTNRDTLLLLYWHAIFWWTVHVRSLEEVEGNIVPGQWRWKQINLWCSLPTGHIQAILQDLCLAIFYLIHLYFTFMKLSLAVLSVEDSWYVYTPTVINIINEYFELANRMDREETEESAEPRIKDVKLSSRQQHDWQRIERDLDLPIRLQTLVSPEYFSPRKATQFAVRQRIEFVPNLCFVSKCQVVVLYLSCELSFALVFTGIGRF